MENVPRTRTPSSAGSLAQTVCICYVYGNDASRVVIGFAELYIGKQNDI